MTEQLISFKTAKLAKEKGFDVSSGQGLGAAIYSAGKVRYTCHLDGSETHAPTQSLLQKWLRETHKIYCNAIPFTKIETTISKDSYPDGFRGVIYPYQILQVQNKYEEALEVALFEALKLIA